MPFRAKITGAFTVAGILFSITSCGRKGEGILAFNEDRPEFDFKVGDQRLYLERATMLSGDSQYLQTNYGCFTIVGDTTIREEFALIVDEEYFLQFEDTIMVAQGRHWVIFGDSSVRVVPLSDRPYPFPFGLLKQSSAERTPLRNERVAGLWPLTVNVQWSRFTAEGNAYSTMTTRYLGTDWLDFQKTRYECGIFKTTVEYSWDENSFQELEIWVSKIGVLKGVQTINSSLEEDNQTGVAPPPYRIRSEYELINLECSEAAMAAYK